MRLPRVHDHFFLGRIGKEWSYESMLPIADTINNQQVLDRGMRQLDEGSQDNDVKMEPRSAIMSEVFLEASAAPKSC